MLLTQKGHTNLNKPEAESCVTFLLPLRIKGLTVISEGKQSNDFNAPNIIKSLGYLDWLKMHFPT